MAKLNEKQHMKEDSLRISIEEIEKIQSEIDMIKVSSSVEFRIVEAGAGTIQTKRANPGGVRGKEAKIVRTDKRCVVSPFP